jgi:hypothetical protein
MMARKKARRVRNGMKKEIEIEYDDFAAEFKMNDRFNLNRFLEIKHKMREKNRLIAESIDEESISEQLINNSDTIATEIPLESGLIKSSHAHP